MPPAKPKSNVKRLRAEQKAKAVATVKKLNTSCAEPPPAKPKLRPQLPEAEPCPNCKYLQFWYPDVRPETIKAACVLCHPPVSCFRDATAEGPDARSKRLDAEMAAAAAACPTVRLPPIVKPQVEEEPRWSGASLFG